jgi:EAL domain-containing protein (putative c-di-GMP-specific phosphodiesterase class I)
MRAPRNPDERDDRYRTGYLKMKSVLYDRATGLPAFPLLFDRLRTLLDQRRELGVIHFEVADLDMVESLYGWQVFDGIVSHIARALREAVGQELPPETLLGLNGVAGDRFVAFIPERPDGSEVDPVFLGQLAQVCCRKLERAFDDDEHAGLIPRLCFRAGYASLSLNPFFRFERCVYAAVEEARTSHQRRERRRELSWGEELQAIIQSHAVESVFQPIVDLVSREVIGHEAFVRGPRDTMFEAPRAMFALSSRVGVATQLDRMCCDAVLEAFARLDDGRKLFVNVLRSSLEEGRWCIEALLPRLEGLGIEPARLVLEISEREVEMETDRLADRVREVKAAGFGIALDDVGTGLAGLAAIEAMGPDYVKLDASLVREIHGNMIRQEVLAGLVGLSAKLGSVLIAEGVETEEEASALAAGGARLAQGYLFATPTPRGAVTAGGRGRSGGDRGTP